jgi:hypothetical protein
MIYPSTHGNLEPKIDSFLVPHPSLFFFPALQVSEVCIILGKCDISCMIVQHYFRLDANSNLCIKSLYSCHIVA